jgi:hypothetical protein
MTAFCDAADPDAAARRHAAPGNGGPDDASLCLLTPGNGGGRFSRAGWKPEIYVMTMALAKPATNNPATTAKRLVVLVQPLCIRTDGNRNYVMNAMALIQLG